MPKYFFTFSDRSPDLETAELTDDTDAVAFAKIVAAEKEPGAFSNGRPRGADDVVEKERRANEEKADEP